MKNTLLLLSFLCFFAGCDHQKLTSEETVTEYYNARDTGDFKKLKTVVSDSITMISGDYVMPYTRESFYEQFKWDSVFKPSYDIIELEEENNQVIVTVAQANIRNEFLKNNPLVYRVKISFVSGKISKLEDLEDVGTDWNVWLKKRDTLVGWVKKNYPEQDGFVNDMTMKGAMDYVNVIDLYISSRLKE